jgi:hypothetical protein
MEQDLDADATKHLVIADFEDVREPDYDFLPRK